jgi:NADH-quinone oxidoreductase subunit N
MSVINRVIPDTPLDAVEPAHMWIGNSIEFLSSTPEVACLVSLQVLLVYGVWWGTQKPYPILSGHMLTWVVGVLVAMSYLVISSPFQDGLWIWNNSWSFTPATRTVQFILIGFAIVALLLGKTYQRVERINAFEWSILLLVAVFGLMGMISANDFLAFYLMLELQSFCFYVLAASKRSSTFSTEAALKYFILGALASGLLLFGAALCYGVTGTLCWTDLALVSPYFYGTDIFSVVAGESLGYTVGMVFLWLGLLFKVSAFPFHIWTPDVYEGAPTPITAFFALVPKLAAFYVLLSWLSGPFYSQADLWQPLIFLSAAGSMIIGSLGALAQRNLKRLLAYSTIGHVGYILMGLASGSEEGLSGAMFYIWVYTLMSMGCFALILGCLRHAHSDPRQPGIGSDASIKDEHPTVGNAWLYSRTAPCSTVWSNENFKDAPAVLYSDRMLAPQGTQPLYHGGMSGTNRPPVLMSMDGDKLEIQANVNPLMERQFVISRFWASWKQLGQTQRLQSIQDLAGLGLKNKMLGLSWMLIFFSMAGVPPLAGFWSKYTVFISAVGAQWYTLTLIGVVTSVIGAFYYLRIIKTVYFPTSQKNFNLEAEFSWSMDKTQSMVLAFVLLAVVFLAMDAVTFVSFASLCLPGVC